MPMPNFLVLGASKSGTTSLHYYLDQHPEIYMSPGKQTYFFAFEDEDPFFPGPGDMDHMRQHLVTRLEDYRGKFSDINGHKAIGEVCSPYLYIPKAAERIHHHIPDAKLIVILRNPVDRAYSSFMHLRRDGHEPCEDFNEAFHKEDERMRQNWRNLWFYKSVGLYYRQIHRYFQLFDRSQIRIYIYEKDYLNNTAWLLKDIYQFLGVDDNFEADTTVKHHVGGIPRSKKLHDFVMEPRRVKNWVKSLVPKTVRKRLKNALTVNELNMQKEPLSPELRQALTVEFKEDIIDLQKLIGCDLSHWMH